MKKLLIALLAFTSITYAAVDRNLTPKQCINGADRIVSRLDAQHKTSFTIKYSSNNEDNAAKCKSALIKADAKAESDGKNKLNITLQKLSKDEGKNVFEFSNFNE